MTSLQTRVKTEQTIRATVIRADGSREELGVISYWHRNPLIRAYRRAMLRLAAYWRTRYGRSSSEQRSR